MLEKQDRQMLCWVVVEVGEPGHVAQGYAHLYEGISPFEILSMLYYWVVSVKLVIVKVCP